MKKLYLFAATLAVAAAMTSCSEKEVVEQIAEPVAKGEPFGVTATIDNGGTRGGGTNADVDVTTASLKNKGFRMTGLPHGKTTGQGDFMVATDNTTQMNTLAFSFTGDKWSAGSTTFNWSEGGTQAYDFFAVGNNTGKRSPYIDPVASGTNPSDPDNIPVDNEDGIISFPSFEYNLPANAKNHEDLIVASALGKNSGKVGLDFKHALTKINVKAVYRESFLQKTTGVDYNALEAYFFIKKIIFHGLANKATFTFGNDESVGSWGTYEHNGAITMDFSSSPIFVKSYDPEEDTGSTEDENWNAAKMQANDDAVTTGIVNMGCIYAIPEEISNMTPVWDYVPGSPIEAAEDLDAAITAQQGSTQEHSIKNHAYVEIQCCFALGGENTDIATIADIPAYDPDVDKTISVEWQVGGDTKDDTMTLQHWGDNDDTTFNVGEPAAGWGTVYLPLNLVSVGLAYNGEVNLILNLHRSSVLSEESEGNWYFRSSVAAALPEAQ